MKIDKYEFPEALYYEQNHYWAKVADELVVVGVTDYAQQAAGEIIFFEAPRSGKTVTQGKPFASIESGKWVGRVYAPVSGKVVEINEELEDDASPINSDPYGSGWLVKIEPSDLSELENLMKAGTDEFNAWIQAELAKNS